jgi:hypothetical protein
VGLAAAQAALKGIAVRVLPAAGLAAVEVPEGSVPMAAAQAELVEIVERADSVAGLAAVEVPEGSVLMAAAQAASVETVELADSVVTVWRVTAWRVTMKEWTALAVANNVVAVKALSMVLESRCSPKAQRASSWLMPNRGSSML